MAELDRVTAPTLCIQLVSRLRYLTRRGRDCQLVRAARRKNRLLLPTRNRVWLPPSSLPLLKVTNNLRVDYLRFVKRIPTATFLFLFWTLISAPGLLAQHEPSENRKIVNRVTPQYPEIARSMNLAGTVKAEAVVAPNGVVKSVEVRGGHPVLVRAAENAIYKWKWAPASHETREPIEVKFDPR